MEIDIKGMVADTKDKFAENASQESPKHAEDETPAGANPTERIVQEKTDSSLHNESSEETESEEKVADDKPKEDTQEAAETEYSGEVTSSEDAKQEESNEGEPLSRDEFANYVFSEIGDDEELKQELLQKLGIVQNEFASPEIEKINQWVKEGKGSIEDYNFVNKTLDLDNMDNTTSVKAQMRVDNPDLSNEDIEVLFEDQYPSDEDEYDEKTIRKSEIKLRNDGAKAKRSLSELKGKYQAPKQSQPAQQNVLPETFGNDYANSVADLEGYSFDLGQGKSFKYDFKGGEAEALSKRGYDTSHPLSYWNIEGNFNMDKFTDDIAFLENKNKVVKAAYTQGSNTAREEGVKDRKNIDLPSTTASPAPASNKDAKFKEQNKQFMDKLGFK